MRGRWKRKTNISWINERGEKSMREGRVEYKVWKDTYKIKRNIGEFLLH